MPQSGGASSFTGHNRLGRNVMPSSGSSKYRAFTVFRTAAEEVQLKQDEHAWDNEGGHMSSTGGHVMRRPEAELPYVVTLTHHLSETTEHSFASMREAEAFIKRNTPVPGAVLSTTYDRPAPSTSSDTESVMNDESILARLKVIDRRLRQISEEDAASVLAGGLANAGIREPEKLRLIAETERILDELDGETND
jgi:hypothetical protein